MPFYHDDGTEINPDLVPKPSLCVSCRKEGDPMEEILCILTSIKLHKLAFGTKSQRRFLNELGMQIKAKMSC